MIIAAGFHPNRFLKRVITCGLLMECCFRPVFSPAEELPPAPNSSPATEWHPVIRHGLYEDFRAETASSDWWFPKYVANGKPIPESGVRFAPPDKNEFNLGLFPKNSTNSTNYGDRSQFTPHLLAQELNESQLRQALTNGHFYLANEALGNPTTFTFGAVNNLGVFSMGDTALSLGKTRLVALSPLPARWRLFYEDAVVKETTGTNLIFETKEAGSYRVEGWRTVAGVEQPWILSSAVRLRGPALWDLRLPSMTLSPGVELQKDISYRDSTPEDAAKTKLDLYRPKDKTNAPIFFFIHGGAWKTGDRNQYLPVGNRFANAGYVTVIPSYRLAPKHPHPAQVEDVASAFAWMVQHIAEYGGDTNRIFVGGHSAGGHLAALLSLDDRYLAAQQLSPRLIRGVLALSGVYNLSTGDNLDFVFSKNPQARTNAAPLTYVKAGAPPFFVSFCEWDYFTLPAQAREFQHALQQAGVRTELFFVPQESHISEMIGFSLENNSFSVAALKFMNGL